MTRLHGRGPGGQRVVDAVPHGHRTAATFLCGRRLTGVVAPMAIDGALTGEHVLAYLRQALRPELTPGDMVVMGNLRAHELAGVAAVPAEHRARVLYLPPDSPDLNPIEQALSRVTARLRRERLRTVDELWRAFGRSLDWVTPSHAANYFQDAGYLPE